MPDAWSETSTFHEDEEAGAGGKASAGGEGCGGGGLARQEQ